MSNNFENEEITISFNKLWHIIWSRKFVIIICFITFLVLAVIKFNITPKKYISETRLLINNASSTNLSDINPFVVSDGGGSMSGVQSFFRSSSNIDAEIEIMKSPLVMDKVIKDNNLKYTSGLKAGRYLETRVFLNPNLRISNIRGTNIVSISYKSHDPKFSYSIVNTLINNYKGIYEDINSKKASKDKEFIQNSYLKAKKAVDEKIAQLKQFKSSSLNNSGTTSGGINGLLSLYDKRISKDSINLSKANLDNRKLEVELEQEIEKLKMLKSKYEWISLVENMSKNATNVVILKQPEILEKTEFSEPNLKHNIIVALLISFSVSSLLLLLLEKINPKFTYSALDDKSIVFDNRSDIDISDIKANMLLKNAKQISLISLSKEGNTQEFANLLSQSLRSSDMRVSLSKENNSIDEHIQNVVSSEYVVFLTQLNHTDKKVYYKLREFCKKANKDYLTYLTTFNLPVMRSNNISETKSIIR
ncbi:MAG: hypothetical protein ACD_20C00413G0023 [uncultured bacterium]|nr:MAG: hypothetical protein ACD_20C00413G0023 [uncultured bacterium]